VTPPWVVPGVIDEVIDGDTVRVSLDLGPHCGRRVKALELGWHVRIDRDGHIRMESLVRIDGINAPEHGTPAGDAATAYAKTLLQPGDQVQVVSKKLLGSTEKYGRTLADLSFRPRIEQRPVLGDFATAMIAAGHAKPWDGTGTRPL
jgi:endonuclease YncB( thermonuclease family)